MKRILLVMVAVVLFSTWAFAGAPKSYQVTGPVLDIKDDVITVQKGDDKWELAKDKDTKVSGDLKVGSKVLIQYQMKASSIEVKDAAKKEETKKKK
jgi:hypothetical protein